MSDDTPTQKFEAPGTDAPTEVIGGPPTPPAGTPATASGDAEKSRRLMIILIAIGSALVLILLLLLVLLLTRGSGEPTPAPTPTESTSASPTPSVTPSPTPSATPTPTPTPTPTQTVEPPPPPPPSPITSFTASDTTVECDGESSVPVTFSWAATGETLWFGVGTDNAKNAPYSEFPLNYTFDFDYQCGQPDQQQRYTITVESSGGSVTSKTIIIKE